MALFIMPEGVVPDAMDQPKRLVNLLDIGNGNTGNNNEGNFNSGNNNTGDYNCGDNNSGNYEGCANMHIVDGKVVSAAKFLVSATAAAAAMLFAASY